MIAFPETRISPSPKNKAETDPNIGLLRIRALTPYALARLGRLTPELAAQKRWSIRADRAELAAQCGCGTKTIAEFVRKICAVGPENIRGTDLLKRAPGGGKGRMKIKQHLRKPLADAIQKVCVDQGMMPGHRRTTTAILSIMREGGLSAKDLPSRHTVAFHSRRPLVLAARTAVIEGEHMVRVVGESVELLAIGGCVYIDCTTFTSNDYEEDQVIVLDTNGRELGILNAIVGLDAATRGVWTMLPVVGAVNSYLVGMAVRRGLLSKAALLQQYGISGELPYCGKPKRISHDCGSEFLNEHVERVLFDMAIPFVDVCPPYTPYFRGKAERFNRTAHSLFAEFLRSDVTKKYLRKVPGKPKAAGILFNDLDRAMIEWIVTDYHNRPHRGLGGQTPIQRFESLARGGDTVHKSGYPVPLQDTPELMWDFLWEVPRVVGHTGIHLWNRRYVHPRLMELFVPGKRSSRRRLPVRANPYALGVIYTRVAGEYGGTEILQVPWEREYGRYLMDENTSRQAANPSLWEWKAIYNDLRRAGVNPTRAEAEKLAEKREAHETTIRGSRGKAPTRQDRSHRAMRDRFKQDVPLAPKVEVAIAPAATASVATRKVVLLPTGEGGADEY